MRTLLSFLKRFKWELTGGAILFFVVLVNLFPQGYIILGGDILQPISMKENFSFYFYEWNGRVSLYYGIFYILDWLGVTSTAQISWYLGIFLLGAYFSFLIFSSLIFPWVSGLVRSVVALFYATNLFTLYLFTATWGYSSYPILYVFIPILTGFYIRVLQSTNKKYLFGFFILVFFSASSFGNPAFALATLIYFSLVTIFLFLFKFIQIDKNILKKIGILIGMSILLNAYWILPLLPQLKGGITAIYNSEEVNLAERLKKTSNSIYDTIRLLPTSEQSRYFPANFPYQSLKSLEPWILLVTFIPFLILLAGFLRKMRLEERRLYGIFLALSLIFICLIARVRFPFDVINQYLFFLPGMNALRSYDKFAMFMPFLICAPLLLAIPVQYTRLIVGTLFIVIMSISLPFYLGGLQTKMSYILTGQKDYREAKYSALVKVPDAYWDVQSILNANKDEYKVSMLPFSSGSSIGRVNLPDWKVNGPHVGRNIYRRSFVELTEPYFPGWSFPEEFENNSYNPAWIPATFGLIGVKYILYHKDAKKDNIIDMEPARVYLERLGELVLVKDYPSFTLYQLNESRIFPYVYSLSTNAAAIVFSPEEVREKTELLSKERKKIEYTKENSKSISVEATSLSNSTHLVLNERHDLLWRAQYIPVEGESFYLDRDDEVLYGNAWKIPALDEGEIHVYYKPYKDFLQGLVVSATTLVFLFIYYFRQPRKSSL